VNYGAVTLCSLAGVHKSFGITIMPVFRVEVLPEYIHNTFLLTISNRSQDYNVITTQKTTVNVQNSLYELRFFLLVYFIACRML
jgi:hypothetical protein